MCRVLQQQLADSAQLHSLCARDMYLQHGQSSYRVARAMLSKMIEQHGCDLKRRASSRTRRYSHAEMKSARARETTVWFRPPARHGKGCASCTGPGSGTAVRSQHRLRDHRSSCPNTTGRRWQVCVRVCNEWIIAGVSMLQGSPAERGESTSPGKGVGYTGQGGLGGTPRSS